MAKNKSKVDRDGITDLMKRGDFDWDRIKDENIREAVRALLDLAEASDECVIIHLKGKSTEYVPMTMAYVEPSLLDFVSEAFFKASDSSDFRAPKFAESQK